MSQSFVVGNGSQTYFVDHGSGAGIDNLPNAGPLSGWVWGFRGADGANQPLLTKDSAGPNGFVFQFDNSPSEGVLLLIAQRATSAQLAISSTVVAPLYTPVFAGFVINLSGSPQLFFGDLTTAVTEVSYNTQNNGSGAYTSDAAANLYAGGLQRSPTISLQGAIQMWGLVSNDALTASEFESIRSATRNAVTNDTDISDALALFTHVAAANYQAGSLADRTGNGHNGTATGSIPGPNFPVVASSGSSGGGPIIGCRLIG